MKTNNRLTLAIRFAALGAIVAAAYYTLRVSVDLSVVDSIHTNAVFAGRYLDFVYATDDDGTVPDIFDIELIILNNETIPSGLLAQLRRCTNLRMLKVEGASLSPSDMEQISELSSLVVLILENCETDSVACLHRLQNLRALSLLNTTENVGELQSILNENLAWLIVNREVWDEIKSNPDHHVQILLELSPYLHPYGTRN